MALYLDLPSPIIASTGCKGQIIGGEKANDFLKGTVCDDRGLKLLSQSAVKGDAPASATRVHDELKDGLLALAQEAGIRGHHEEGKLFAHLLPNVSVGRDKFKGAVPDLNLDIPVTAGASAQDIYLIEVKTRRFSAKWYKAGDDGSLLRSTWGRSQATALADTQRSLAKLDEELLGVPKGQKGPLRQQLDDLPPIHVITFGAAMEGCPELWRALGIFADAYAAQCGGGETETGLRWPRRAISVGHAGSSPRPWLAALVGLCWAASVSFPVARSETSQKPNVTRKSANPLS